MTDYFNLLISLWIFALFVCVLLLQYDITKLEKSDRKIDNLVKTLNEKDYNIFCKLMYEKKDKK